MPFNEFASQRERPYVSVRNPPVASSDFHILLVEDDPALQRSIRKGLTEQDYQIHGAGDIKTARHILRNAAIDLAVLDLGLPDGSGLELLTELRGQGQRLPVIILTARDTVADKVKGLDLGADDYLVKPFDFNELLARIRARLRRAGEPQTNHMKVGDLDIDLVARTVKRDGDAIELTPKEFDVLAYMVQAAGQPVSRQMLTSEVWKIRSRMTSMDNVIDVMISRLREKVDGNRTDKLIHTIRGVGFTIRQIQ
jgi:two-component system copper resistance phosphate regulon response regulator CusR